MSSPLKMFPEFFKVYLPELSWNRMHIPTAFVKHFNGFVPERAILRDSIGRVWHVEVGQIGKNVYFLKGWQQFLTDNLVEEGDFFVFRYNGSYIFDFKLFGTTGCEKKDSRELHVDVYKKRFFLKGEENVEEVETDKEEVEEEEEEQEEEEASQSKSSNKDVVVFKHKYSCRGPQSIGRKGFSGLGGHKQTSIEKTSSAYDESAHTKSKYKKACTDKVELDGSLDFKSIVKPENPYFITKIRPGRRSKLYVPVDVLKDHNITLPPRVLFRDPHGRSWPGDVAVWKDGRIWIGGWRAFCKWNHVNENDYCICEFVEERGHWGNLIVVHIHRAQPARVTNCNANLRVEREDE